MKITAGLMLAFAFLMTTHVQGQDITENKFGKGLVNVVAKDSSYSANFAFRMQSLYTSNWGISEDEGFGTGETNFLVRRARLKFQGFAYTPKLEYKLELGLSNRDLSGASVYTGNTNRLILDAVVKWNFYENFELWAGQTKLPGNRERLISSGSLETVDRSLLNSRFNIDRDMGVQLHHETYFGSTFLMREAISIAQGEGRNVTAGNIGGLQYTGRLEVLPFGDFDDYSGADFAREDTPKLAGGVAYDYNKGAVRTRSNSGSYMLTDYGFFETNVTTLFVDAMFKYRGISAMAEYAHRSADNAFSTNADGKLTGDAVNIGKGFNVQAGYLFENNIQMIGRYTKIDLDDRVTQLVEDQYTLGLSKYIVKHKLKVQTDINYTDFNIGLDDNLTYRLQFELHL